MTPFKTSRKIPATAEEIFAAFQPQRLARWWGPNGFTNTFTHYEFKNGGRWSLTMHGPDGKSYPNENVFAEIDAPKKVVIQHVSEPKFRLTITLETSTDGTVVFWTQEFENSEVARQIEHIVVPANNQNLERLAEELVRR